MHARHSLFTDLPPGGVRERVETVVADLGPWIRQFDGFRGFVILADETRGQAVAISFWADEHSLRRSGEAIARMRESIADLLRASAHDAGTYTVDYWDWPDPPPSLRA